MTPLWLAMLPEDPGSAVVGSVHDRGGRPAGFLCLWRGKARPHEQALLVDPRVHDPAGPACVVSLALAPIDARPITDDPAVVQARRDVLRDGRASSVSLLSADAVEVGGAITVARADRSEQVAALRDDPFARLWSARILRVTAGVFGTVVRPTGPSLERYGGMPWPYDRF